MEKFIKENRAAFDTETPTDAVWARIEGQLAEKKAPVMIELKWVYRIAASVAIILSVGVLAGYYIGTATTTSQMAQQMVDVERYYQNKMDDKMAELASYQATDVVASEINDLESRYASLASEDVYVEERHMQAVIENFEARLAIMEKVLLRMKQYSNKGKKGKNENVQLEI